MNFSTLQNIWNCVSCSVSPPSLSSPNDKLEEIYKNMYNICPDYKNLWQKLRKFVFQYGSSIMKVKEIKKRGTHEELWFARWCICSRRGGKRWIRTSEYMSLPKRPWPIWTVVGILAQFEDETSLCTSVIQEKMWPWIQIFSCQSTFCLMTNTFCLVTFNFRLGT